MGVIVGLDKGDLPEGYDDPAIFVKHAIWTYFDFWERHCNGKWIFIGTENTTEERIILPGAKHNETKIRVHHK